MDLKEAVAAIATASSEEGAKALFDGAKDLWQGIWNTGYGKRQAEDDKAVKEAEEAKVAADKALTKAQGKITKLESDKPDLEAIRTEVRKEAAETMAAKQTEIDDLKAGRLTDKKSGAKAHMLSKLKGVVDVYARTAVRDAIEERVTFDEDGNMTVYQPGTKIPVAPKEGQNPLDLVAEEILKGTPKELRVSTVGNDGTGTQGGGDPPPGGKWDESRKRMQEHLKEGRPDKKATERLDAMFPTAKS